MMVAKVRSRSSDKAGLGVFIRLGGKGRALARARGEGRARPMQPPSKTLIHGRPSRSRGPNLRV